MKEYSPEIKKQLKKLGVFDRKIMDGWLSKVVVLFALVCTVALFFLVDLGMAFWGALMIWSGSVLTHVNYVIDPEHPRKIVISFLKGWYAGLACLVLFCILGAYFLINDGQAVIEAAPVFVLVCISSALFLLASLYEYRKAKALLDSQPEAFTLSLVPKETSITFHKDLNQPSDKKHYRAQILDEEGSTYSAVLVTKPPERLPSFATTADFFYHQSDSPRFMVIDDEAHQWVFKTHPIE